MRTYQIILFLALITLLSCNKDTVYETIPNYPTIAATFTNSIDVANLENYANQNIPPYITKDNGTINPISDKGATLGRVLFYDTNLSSNNSIACASCHKQANAFGDNVIVSVGVNGTTGRHSMRLVNARFSNESKFFWDERAASLEIQTTMPIKDHGEMGFSGTNGDLSFNDLIFKLNNIDYYKELFTFVYGSDEITETKIQNSLAQFIRSIQSFDSKYDAGRALVNNDNQPFPNFSQQENLGKNLFLTPPQFDGTGSRIGGGVGCAGCHRAPEFDIDPNSLNNGIIGTVNNIGIDITNTRAPSLRDLVKQDGTLNTTLMHTGTISSLQAAIGHYNIINLATGNTNLDPKLQPGGNGQQLNMTGAEMSALQAFLVTLAGSSIYTDSKWSNPFE
ncbi:cytochrome-c peroxidase [Flavobacterium jejuense]|uniref:Cytochrome-c peroxidase n=1 Tax=Flavobacterium jejuense TaxID=1544455 RepID=A0ABX0IPW6_9FLAO|nr:cytochrome c peroxidase [Flavobacterium jejuense]NHN25882.1 cytochrome-c peroxidase [Flavobacterium jejuense]